jgi:hypothetical protein
MLMHTRALVAAPSSGRSSRGALAEPLEGRVDGVLAPLSRVARQRIWLHLRGRPWRTLAVVPAEVGMPAHLAARMLASLAAEHGEDLDVFDARGTSIDRAAVEVAAASEGQRRVILLTSAIDENIATIPLARAADAAVLCVTLGATSLRAAGEVVNAVGKDRFLGSLSIRPRRPGPEVER